MEVARFSPRGDREETIIITATVTEPRRNRGGTTVFTKLQLVFRMFIAICRQPHFAAFIYIAQHNTLRACVCVLVCVLVYWTNIALHVWTLLHNFTPGKRIRFRIPLAMELNLSLDIRANPFLTGINFENLAPPPLCDGIVHTSLINSHKAVPTHTHTQNWH